MKKILFIFLISGFLYSQVEKYENYEKKISNLLKTIDTLNARILTSKMEIVLVKRDCDSSIVKSKRGLKNDNNK